MDHRVVGIDDDGETLQGDIFKKNQGHKISKA